MFPDEKYQLCAIVACAAGTTCYFIQSIRVSSKHRLDIGIDVIGTAADVAQQARIAKHA